MSVNGVQQLTKLSIRFCRFGGSSRFVRQLPKYAKFIEFACLNSSVDIVFVQQNGKHPCVRAEYVCGRFQVFSLRNEREAEVLKTLERVRNRRPRKMDVLDFWQKPKSKVQSIQGIWAPEVVAQKPIRVDNKC